ncbi:MAG: TolC family protein [Planctomycetes bacterium]|nr:TolC family protein [Planctomycetota bacterium]
MPIRVSGGAGSSPRLIPSAAGILLILIGGCAAPRPDPQAEAAATRSLGLEHALAFRWEGGPLDEPEAGGETLTLGDAVRRAATSDPEMQAALARVRIAMADADQARLLPNPVLDFALGWGPGQPRVAVSLTQDLIRALRIPRASSAADHRLRQSVADAVTVALDGVAEAQERYIAAQALESLLPVLLSRRDLVDKMVAVARARLEAGEGTRNDLTTLETQRVELAVDIADARRDLREERLRLARLIGEPSAAAAWRLDPWSPPAPATTAEAVWIDSALAHRPEVQSAAWRLAALGDEEALTRLLPWEGAGVGANVGREEEEEWFAGPSVSTPLPVFDTGQAAQARVSAEQVEARHHLTLARRKVVEEVRVALQSFEADAANLVRVRTELIPLQEQRRRQAEDAYRAGQTDVTALFLAEQDLQAARAKEIDVERRLSVALVRLQRAVGGAGVAVSLLHVTPRGRDHAHGETL